MPATLGPRLKEPPGGRSAYIISRLKPESPWLGLTRIENHHVMVPVTDRVTLQMRQCGQTPDMSIQCKDSKLSRRQSDI